MYTGYGFLVINGMLIKGIWLKSPPTQPTPPTIISSPYQLNKQVEQSGEFMKVNIHFMLINGIILKAQMQTVEDKRPALVCLWPVQAANYGWWCLWWLQSVDDSVVNGAMAVTLEQVEMTGVSWAQYGTK